MYFAMIYNSNRLVDILAVYREFEQGSAKVYR